jgi:hypothetical protein
MLLGFDVVDVAILLMQLARRRAGHAIFVAADATWAACIVVNNLARSAGVAVVGCGCDAASPKGCVKMRIVGSVLVGSGLSPCKCSCHGPPPASAPPTSEPAKSAAPKGAVTAWYRGKTWTGNL